MAALLFSIPKIFRTTFWFLLFFPLFAIADSSIGSEVALANFCLKIGAHRKSVLLLEPIVFQASLTNHSDKPLIVKHLPSQTAAAFVYQVRGTNESYQDLEKSVRRDWPDCGNDRETNRAWGIYGHATLPDRIWIPNGFPAGSYKFRVVFRILAGEFAGSEIASDEVEIMVLNPTGTNKTAYDFWKGGHTFSAPWVIGNQLVGWRLQAYPSFLIPNSGSHLSRPEHDFFLQNCSNSAYADYVRYTMTTYLGYKSVPDPAYRATLIQLCENSPRDFPLLTDCYVALFQLYKKEHDFGRMFALGEQVKKERALLPPEQWPGQLDQLLQESASRANTLSNGN